MSNAAVAWALDVHRTGPMSAEARLVLVALADYTGPGGHGAFPLQTTLASRLGISDRAVRRSVASLMESGVLVEGDQQLVAHYAGNHRPKVYDLAMDRATDRTPTSGVARTPTSGHRPDVGGHLDRTPASDITKNLTKHQNPQTPFPLAPTPVSQLQAPWPQTDAALAAARYANGQRPDGSCRVCDAIHPAGTSHQTPAANAAALAAAAKAALRAEHHPHHHLEQPVDHPPGDRLDQIRTRLDEAEPGQDQVVTPDDLPGPKEETA